MRDKKIRVSREWLGTTIPTALEMVLRGIDHPAWCKDMCGLTPQAVMRNIIESLRQQARQGERQAETEPDNLGFDAQGNPV